ncbi:MAG: helix-turn-helix domain-containing protein [Rhodospirillaceae bacterium]|nr:helix-turn-helix domain-containing protein [Rhodospirillaceae bacterium]
MVYKKSELNEVGDGAVPSSDVELGTRINAVIDLYGRKKDAADAAGVSAEQLKRYVRGLSAAPFDVLSRLAAPKRINLNWLATGQGEMRLAPLPSTYVDIDLFGKITDGVATVYREENARMGANDHGKTSARIFNKLIDAYTDPGERIVGLKLALEELRRDLRSTPAADAPSSKRSA